MKNLKHFLLEEDGQDLAEYVAILGAIAVVAAAVVYRYRDRLMAMWESAIANLR